MCCGVLWGLCGGGVVGWLMGWGWADRLVRGIDFWMTSIACMMVTMSTGMRMKGMVRNVWMILARSDVGRVAGVGFWEDL